MKLYYSPGACSLAPHIVAREAGLDITLERVDLRSKRTEHGRDFAGINPKNYVPALALDDVQLLTEGPVISQYLADHAATSDLLPAPGSLARYRVQEMLNYITAELHKSFSPLFKPDTPEATRDERKAYLLQRYALIEQQLAKGPYLFGEAFTIADAYLYTVTRWAPLVGLDLAGLPALQAFQQRVTARPAVQAALRAEGLVPASKAA